MKRSFWQECVPALALASAALVGPLAQAEDGANVIRIQTAAGDEVIEADVLVESESPVGSPAVQSKLWLGVGCQPMNDTLKAQLGRKEGLVVETVIDDSPAAKAGIQRHDILLRLDDTALNDVIELGKLINPHEGKPLTIVLLRAGKEITSQITPEQRPQGMQPDLVRIERDIERKLEMAYAPHKAITMALVRPGFAVKPDEMKSLDLPAGTSISIKKQDSKPAQIEVKRGDKTWTTTEDKLDELPDDVRVLVEQMRGQAIHFRLPTPPENLATKRVMSIPATPGVPGGRTIVRGLTPGMPARVLTMQEPPQPQLAELNRKLDQVLKAVHGPSEIESLQKDVKRLREEVEALRQRIDK
jgi:hypothetical protein